MNFFIEFPKGVILTEQGENFIQKLLEIIHKMEDAIASFDKNEIGQLKVGSTECNAVVRISPFLIKLHEDFPNMQLELLLELQKV